MPLTFTFDLSQQQFELRCDKGTRRLSNPELLQLIEQCEHRYYSGRPKDGRGQEYDTFDNLIDLGRRLYLWLDGNEGWLRAALATGQPQAIAFDLNYSLEVQGLNAETERIALGLAHLPWELLHDGTSFLLQTQAIAMPPMRIVQQRPQTLQAGQSDVANRPLHLLLMATAPEGSQLLDYEQEEANIVEATKDQPLLLVVEESGSVAELTNLIRFYPEGYFDIFHLTGHGLIFTQQDYGGLAARIQPPPQIADNTPCMLTEDELGNVQLTTVADLAQAFGDRFPRIIFLSGCHTGEVPDRGSVPSMAQALVKAGAQLVLGWARPVYDRTAIVAAQVIYRELAAASSVEQAVKVAVQEMIRQKCSDWHLLRVYRDSRSLTQLVTPTNTPKRERLKRIQPEQDFLDAQDQVKVASQFEFIGRRRPLQRCLAVMKPSSDRIGVFIQGMGGLGKSTLAARLCRRVQAQQPGLQRVVLIGVVNEITLLQKLSSAYERSAEIPEILNQPRVSLKGRLQNFIEAVEALDQPLLLVLDDFEQNIPPSAIADRTLRPITPASDVLTALCGALDAMQQEINAISRVIVTCRYACPLPPTLKLERLEQMQPADIQKKCRLRPDYSQVSQHPQYARVIKIADGNPRLLEWLLNLLQQPDLTTGLDQTALLSQLEHTEQRFREDILAETLLHSLSEAEQQFLAQLSVFQLPVTQAVVAAVVPDLQPLSKTLALSLVESATTHTEPEYRVTSILAPLLQPVLSGDQWQLTAAQAAQAVHRTWWEESETPTEPQALEIVRLALWGKETEMAVKVGNEVAKSWVNNSRFVEALNLCQTILAHGTDYRILGTIARAEAVLGQVEDAVAHYQQALDLCPDDDLERKASILNNMAGVIANQGDIDRALDLWQQSLEIQERIGDVQGKAATLNNMAGVIANQGDIERALDLWQQSLEIKERIGDIQGKATTLNNMAGVIANQGDIERALDLWQQSLDIKERIGDVQGKAATLNNMAQVIANQGDIERALDLWQQSLEIKERIGDVQGKATTLNNMAGVIANQGHIERALDLWQQSLEIQERIGDVQGKATTLGNMARLIASQGDIERALDLWQQSLEIKERIGHVQGKATTLNNMAGVIANQGHIERALDLWQQSLEIQERIGDVQGKATTLGNMARLIANQGDIERAIHLWQQSLEIQERIGHVQGKVTTLNNVAQVIADQGDIERAIHLWQQSLEISEHIGNVQGKAATLNNMARLIANQGDIERAIHLWQQSLEISERIGNVQSKAATLNNMAQVTANQGDIERALDLWQQSLEIKERIGDVQGKAVTVSWMAYMAGKAGDRASELDLNLQAAQALGQVRAYSDLIIVLGNLGVTAETNALTYLEQALWLALRIQPPLTIAINLANALHQRVPQGDELEALLAAFALALCAQRGQGHPQLTQLQERAGKMMAAAADAQGIATQDAFDDWFTQQQLNDSAVFLPRLSQRLEALIDNQWAFDPSSLQ